MNINVKKRVAMLCMRYAEPNYFGRFASFLAWLVTPGYKDLVQLSYMHRRGFIHPFSSLNHPKINLGENIYIDSDVSLYQSSGGGRIQLDNLVRVMRGSILETGNGGRVAIGEHTWIHPHCHLLAFHESIIIGSKVLVAANCAFYPHNHEVKAGMIIFDQPCSSKGPIVIEDGCWLGTGVTVLGGVTIGEGAVIGAGSIVTKNIPANAIAVGNPAKVIRYRT